MQKTFGCSANKLLAYSCTSPFLLNATYTCYSFVSRPCYSRLYVLCFCFTGTTEKHPLMAQAMVLAKNSVMESSRKSYRSTWNKWEFFLHKYFLPVWTDTHYTNIDYTTLLDTLLMFVTYLAHELRCNVRSIPCRRYVMEWFPAWSSAAMRSTTICFGL